MSNYRRARVPGATYFFTVNLRNRTSDLLIREIDLLRETVGATKARHPFHIDAWVVLPEHMHCLWTLPPDDANFALRWKRHQVRLQQAPARQRSTQCQPATPPRAGLWQRRYWEDERDYQRHFDYIHYNPLKHGHVQRLVDWPYSSFHRAVAMGIYAPD